MDKAKDIPESIKMSTEALNIFSDHKIKNLWSKFSEEHLKKVTSRCLLKRDYVEYANEWAKEELEPCLQVKKLKILKIKMALELT